TEPNQAALQRTATAKRFHSTVTLTSSFRRNWRRNLFNPIGQAARIGNSENTRFRWGKYTTPASVDRDFHLHFDITPVYTNLSSLSKNWIAGGPADETVCPTSLVVQGFAKLGGAGGLACRANFHNFFNFLFRDGVGFVCWAA